MKSCGRAEAELDICLQEGPAVNECLSPAYRCMRRVSVHVIVLRRLLTISCGNAHALTLTRDALTFPDMAPGV